MFSNAFLPSKLNQCISNCENIFSKEETTAAVFNWYSTQTGSLQESMLTGAVGSCDFYLFTFVRGQEIVFSLSERWSHAQLGSLNWNPQTCRKHSMELRTVLDVSMMSDMRDICQRSATKATFEVNGRARLCGGARAQVWVNAMTDGLDLRCRDGHAACDRYNSAADWIADALRFGTFKGSALLVILLGWAAITASQMWNNGLLHQKEQMNVDSGVGLIGTIVFPEGELMTWSQLGDIWRPITAAALMVTWFRCTSECFLIRQRRSPGY